MKNNFYEEDYIPRQKIKKKSKTIKQRAITRH